MDGQYSYAGYQVGHQQPMERSLLAFRIMDGMFLGNFVAAADYEFIQSNKITHIINCCGNEITNQFEGYSYEIKYLTYYWRDDARTQLFDGNEESVRRAKEFIEDAFSNGECVLLHSLNGINRACALIAGFLIMKYKWNYEKTMKYVALSHPEMRIKSYFRKQLRDLEKKHLSYQVMSSLEERLDMSVEKEQILLTNTFVNCLPFSNVQVVKSGEKKPKKRVKFNVSVQVYPHTTRRRKPHPVRLDLTPRRSCLAVGGKKKESSSTNGSGGTTSNVEKSSGYIDYLMMKKKKEKKSLFFIDAHNTGNSFIIEDSVDGSPPTPQPSSEEPKVKKKKKKNNFNDLVDHDLSEHRRFIDSMSSKKPKKRQKFQYRLVSMSTTDTFSGPQRQLPSYRDRPKVSKRFGIYSPKLNSNKNVVGKRKDYTRGHFDDEDDLSRSMVIFPNTRTLNRNASRAYRKRAPTPLSKTRKRNARMKTKEKQSTALFNKRKAQHYRSQRASSARGPKRLTKSSAGPMRNSYSGKSGKSGKGGFLPKTISRNSRKGKVRPKSSYPQMSVSGNVGVRTNISKKRSQLIYNKYFKHLSYI